jgi:hypothetical protein
MGLGGADWGMGLQLAAIGDWMLAIPGTATPPDRAPGWMPIADRRELKARRPSAKAVVAIDTKQNPRSALRPLFDSRPPAKVCFGA